MGAEPFIPAAEPPPADQGIRSAWALVFIALGLVGAGAVLAYMLPISAEAQWRRPAAEARVTAKETPAGGDSTTWYVVTWTTPEGARLTGKIAPLLADPQVGRTIAIRYALGEDGKPTVFLDTPLEVWGPPLGILALTVGLLGPIGGGIVLRLVRARRARAPRPGSGPTP